MNVIQLEMDMLSPGVPRDTHAAIASDTMPGMAHQAAGGFLAGVSPDHAAALLAPLLLPLALWLFLGIVELAAKANLSGARGFQREIETASPLARTTAVLLALAGIIHLTLVPGHLAADGGLAILFAVDGVALVGVGVAVFVWRRWRAVAAVLLGMTLAAYLYYLGSGRENPDLVGTLTYLVELVTLGLVWIPRESSHDSRPTHADRSDWSHAAGTAYREGGLGVTERG